MLITVTVLTSAAGHGITVIYNYLLSRPIPYSLYLSKHLSWSWFLAWLVIQIFILERSGLFAVFHELYYCSFPLTLIVGHGNPKRLS